MTTPDAAQGERTHSWPEILPGGEAVLFTIVANPIEDSRIAVLSLETGERTVLVEGESRPQYVLRGIWCTAWAVRFGPCAST